ncbi:Uma2 family endonuclease [Aerosakkonema funiforme]|uniref:Uma2 family endonuclease n=1 Tax=Aerosakkonema funiforme FACHB-1375 TaxID=2949571 RepID=A0A926VDB4_9CYAN|nr:Uma2 family endonuclease [Aerosakkonema funiforme]MBD2180792.1 Uma2 family endonuclease [Aerosakkonema funiforme FACHB-1375]
MTQALPKLMTFDEFLEWKPENGRYELHKGVIVEMPNPTGKHSAIAGFQAIEFGFEIRRLQLPYFIPKECTIKFSDNTGYDPDAIVLDKQAVETNESRWEKESVITRGDSVKLVVEVVSTNWRDDYGYKMIDYEALGIPEYWIVDYLGLGGSRYIGSPKQPTLSVYQLVDGEYQIKLFRGDKMIESSVFPDLNLTAVQIFDGG